MKNECNIHIMSAGANVHNTFPLAINKISPASELYIVVEKGIYENSSEEKIQFAREAIRNSIEELKKIANPFVSDGIHVSVIPDDTLDCIRDVVLEIYKKKHNETPDIKYYFNVSSGTKGLSIGLFMMALWIEAIPYHIDRNGNARIISIPKIHIKDFKANPNRIKILQILNRNSPKPLSRKDLKRELSDQYEAVRKTGKVKRELTYGGFSSLISDLLEWGLIGEKYKENSKKEKEYYITHEGEFTLKFIEL